MKKLLSAIIMGAGILAGPAVASGASLTDTPPMFEFHTQIYDNVGAANAFHFVIGSIVDTEIYVDCGYGPTELEVSQAVFDPESQAIKATTFAGSVGESGIVRVWGDPTLIDYLELNGLYMDRVDISAMTDLKILDMAHNYLGTLDLTPHTRLEAFYIDDNPFDKGGVKIGSYKPNLTIASMSVIDNLDPEFNISDYPQLASFDGWNNPSLTHVDPTGCPELLKLSIDVTNVSSLNLSNNAKLRILNIGETKITDIDLSHTPNLTDLYISHNGQMNSDYKLTDIDLSHTPHINRMILSGNLLTHIDLSNLTELTSLGLRNNMIESIDIKANKSLYDLDLGMNLFSITTLPEPQVNFSQYFYDQRPMPLDLSYPEGAVIDLSDKVLRPFSTTTARMFAVDSRNPGEAVELGAEYFEYADGKVKLNKVYADSVYITFYNTMLSDCGFSTARFLIKNPADYGKPSPVATLKFSTVGTGKTPVFSVGMSGATPESPRKFMVDFGDGVLKEFTATTSILPVEANVSGTRAGDVVIYVADGEYMTALGVKDIRMLSVDLTKAVTLYDLSLTGCQLGNIDLSYNHMLKSLDLSGNRLSSINLSGISSIYTKYRLQDVNLSNNQLTAFETDYTSGYVNIDLSGNRLTSAPVIKASNIKTLNLADNQIEEISLQDLESVTDLDLSGNFITELIIQDYLPLEHLNVANNLFTFASLPSLGRVTDYIYAPQLDYTLPAKCPLVNLSLYQFNDATEFVWRYEADNTPVAEGDISYRNGRFYFDNPDLGKVYCTMSNPAFPALSGDNAIRTTPVLVTGMPQHVFATFTPTALPASTGDEETAPHPSIILTSKTPNNNIFIDWNGAGDIDQYVLKTTYQIFDATVYPGAEVKCYSYDENDGVTVFSLDLPVSKVDVSSMKDLITFRVGGEELTPSAISLPLENSIEEFGIESTLIENVDELIAPLTNLRMLSLGNNKLTSLTVSNKPRLEALYATYNDLTDVSLDCPAVWDLHLNDNNIEKIDLSGVPSVIQLLLNHNKLTELDVESLGALRKLWVDNNCLTFNTLPPVKGNYFDYTYSNQQPIAIEAVDGKVDLSEFADVRGIATAYHWFVDSPYLDDNGELAGEALVEGTDYTIENGVTTFLTNKTHVICVMTNALYPSLYQLSTFVDTGVSGIAGIDAAAGVRVTVEGSSIRVVADGDVKAAVYGVNGVALGEAEGSDLTFGPFAKGIYIVRAGDQTVKAAVR